MKTMSDADILDTVVGLTREYRTHWAQIYTDNISDYRLMSEGKLPADMEAELSQTKYKYDSALVPRMIINANTNLKAMIVNAIFNRSERMEFVGRLQAADHEKAKFANELVDKYAFEVTEVETTVSEMVEDGLETGICYGEVEYKKDYANVLRQGIVPSFVEKFKRVVGYMGGVSQPEVIYDGGWLKYLRTEMVAPEPVRRVENITAYSRLSNVSISDIEKRAEREGSSYYKFRNNIEKINKNDYVDEELQFDPSSDHSKDVNEFETPDFKVQLDVFWMKAKTRFSKNEIKFHRIAVANYDTNPQLLEIISDPMKNNKHPLIVGRIYPRNNRLAGFAAPELLFDLFLEKFAKRNQRVNYMNMAIELAGMLLVPQGTIVDKKSILMKRGKIITLSGSVTGANEVKAIEMSMTPMGTTMQEEAIIDVEVDETVQMNKVTKGQMPTRQEKATTVAIVDENSKILQALPIKNIENSIIKPVARLYLNIFQQFSEDKFIIRILGKEGYLFKDMFRKDFMGYFDVKCYASSEILPKALKQAAYAQMAQVYGSNPKSNIDIDKLAYMHGESLEINMSELIKDNAKVKVEIDREESIMMTFGRPTPPVEHEPHVFHITEHMETMQELMMQGQQDTDVFRALEMHVQLHHQMMAELQGQTNIPTQPNPHNVSEAVNNTSAVNAPKVAGGA